MFYAGFAQISIVYGTLSVEIWCIRALGARIKAVDKVGAPVGEIEVNVQGAMRGWA